MRKRERTVLSGRPQNEQEPESHGGLVMGRCYGNDTSRE